MTYFIKIKHQIELTNIMEIFIQDFNKIVYGFEIVEVIIHDIDTNTKIQSCISTVHNFKVSELKEYI